jgi:hypothetical protein
MGFYVDERWARLFAAAPGNLAPPVPLGGDTRLMGRQAASFQQDWKDMLKAIRTDLKRQAQALVAEYYDGYRELRCAVGKLIKADMTEQYAIEEMFNAVSFVKGKVDAAKSMGELKAARECFLETRGCKAEYLAEEKLVEYERLLEEQKRQDELARAANAIVGYRLSAHTAVRDVAVTTAPIYNAENQPICHMVSVAVDLETGQLKAGRAGHQMGKDQLRAALGFDLPDYAATAFSTQNPYNCAELQALVLLKQQVPGLKMKNVYFAAMMPGGSPIIPPCANCQRWIRAQGATAAKMV